MHRLLILTAKFFLIILIITCHQNIYSKNISKTDSIKVLTKKLKKKGDICYEKEEFYEAIDAYQQYTSLKPKDLKRKYRLALMCYKTRNYFLAKAYCDSVAKLNEKKHPDVLFYKGVVCMNLQEYDKASESFIRFRKICKAVNDKYGYRKLAALYIDNINFLKSNSNSVKKVTISHLDSAINKPNIEFNPVLIGNNKIMYSAVYQDSVDKEKKVRQFFEAVNENGKWKSLGRTDNKLNDIHFNCGNAALTPDGNTVYFTRATLNWRNKIINEVYKSYYENGSWSEPQKLPYPINDQVNTSTQPTIGKNLKNGAEVLYFVSDRKGGKGGLDIWYSEFDEKNLIYKEPVPLDKNVNTPADENSPYFDNSSRTMYFSSTGHNALGGFDIFKSTSSGKKWTKAEPLPSPFNTSYDDYYFVCYNDCKEGFFTSNRPGTYEIRNQTCCDDIFQFKVNECNTIVAGGVIINYANYDFYDQLNSKFNLGLTYPKNNAPIENIPVELFLIKDEEPFLISSTKTHENGEYSFKLERNQQYKIRVKNMGYFDKNISVNTFTEDCSDLNIGQTVISYLPDIQIRLNLYYEYDKSLLNNSARELIDTMLFPLFDMFPNAIIEIGSHTDGLGSESYNLKLSQARSESVVKYLMSKGIAQERLVAKGYGEEIPVAPNENPDGSDNPEGRKLNRRTELKIVGELNSFYRDE